ncbi:UNVERIFIED_CONTAM: hypothetical protein HDU68_003415 [Siphonaria sp. JEL0065]|nr:hypothetical protein HDU68_003415 [Siphonaria sp. JEL0065]
MELKKKEEAEMAKLLERLKKEAEEEQTLIERRKKREEEKRQHRANGGIRFGVFLGRGRSQTANPPGSPTKTDEAIKRSSSVVPPKVGISAAEDDESSSQSSEGAEASAASATAEEISSSSSGATKKSPKERLSTMKLKLQTIQSRLLDSNDPAHGSVAESMASAKAIEAIIDDVQIVLEEEENGKLTTALEAHIVDSKPYKVLKEPRQTMEGKDIDALLQNPYHTTISNLQQSDDTTIYDVSSKYQTSEESVVKAKPPKQPAFTVDDEATQPLLSNESFAATPVLHSNEDALSMATSDSVSLVSTDFKNLAWEKLVHRLFKSVPITEPLFVEHNCAFQGEHFLHQGKMYLTPNFFCFHANIFGYITTFELPIQDILLVKRAKTALIIPNAIIIVTSSKAYFFTSFINRENALKNMDYLIARHRESSLPLPPSKWDPIRQTSTHDFVLPSKESQQDVLLAEQVLSTPPSDQQLFESDPFLAEESALSDRFPAFTARLLSRSKDIVFSNRSLPVLTIMVLAIILCMLLALGSTVVLWKIRGVIGRLEMIALAISTARAYVPDSLKPSATSSEALTEVLSRREDYLRLLLLNRPHALNALNLNMINLITPQLKVWDESDHTKVILLTSVEGCRSFCAGGDVKAMMRARSQAPADLAFAMKFMESEYRLNHLIGTLTKPYISLMNGIAMGGGIGISVHAPFRIATENTLFAMPETSIGLFPDVGGSFFLPRLDGELGTFLGLTGHRLQGVEVFLAGIASHYMPAKRIPALLEALTGIETDEFVEINRVLEKYAEPLNQDVWRNWSLGGDVAGAINRCFKHDTIEEIVEALENENSEWSKKTLKELSSVSPTSLKVTLQQLRRGRKLDFSSCFRMEYRMVQGFLQTSDFFEGVTARLIDKRTPNWIPPFSQLKNINADEIEARFFAPLEAVKSSQAINSSLPKQKLDFLKDLTYYEYPHRTLSGLPTDRDVENVISGKYRRGQQMMNLTKNQDVVNM